MKNLTIAILLLLTLTIVCGCAEAKNNDDKTTTSASETENAPVSLTETAEITETETEKGTEEAETTLIETESVKPIITPTLIIDGVNISEFTIVSKSSDAAKRLNEMLYAAGICNALPVSAGETDGKPSIVIEQKGFTAEEFTISLKDGNIYLNTAFNTTDLAIEELILNCIKAYDNGEFELTVKAGETITIAVGERDFSEYVMNDAVYNKGNLTGLSELWKKAASGEKIVIAALGGSITAGSGANSKESCYASRVYKYLRQEFPQTEIELINAGIGATGSAVGVYRLEADVLSHEPDLVIVEFAVNDADKHTGFENKEAYESIIRSCLASRCAVISLCLPQGASGNALRDGAQNEQKEIGKHYDIPVISITDMLRQNFIDGTMVWQEFSNDTVHPNEEGHKIIANVINAFIDASVKENAAAEDYKLPEIMNSDIFSGAAWYDTEEARPSSYGSFNEVEDPGFYQFKNNWLSEGGSDAEPMVFELEDCKTAAVMYLVAPTGNGFADGKAVVEVDGKTTEYELNAERDTWGKWASPILAFRSPDEKTHNVKITIYPGNGKLSVLRVGQS